MTHRPTTRSVRRHVIDIRTFALPIILVLLLAALATWRFTGDPSPTSASTTSERRFQDVAVTVPSSWSELGRTGDRITWGAADRSGTVTVASTDAGSTPLLALVQAVVDESEEVLPGTSVIAPPRTVDTRAKLAAGDSVVVVEFESHDIPAGGERSAVEPVRVAQVWRRDTRAGKDLVATWTTTGRGDWPIPLRDAAARIN